MILHHGFHDIDGPLRSVVTIGSFDGVHAGHRIILSRLRAMAARLDAESVVVTFEPHPRIAMGRAEGMGLLTTIEERALLLADAGVDHLVVAHFDDKFRSQPYEAFVRDMLVGKLGMVGMIVGYNHRLGRGSEGDYDHLQPLALECGFELERVSQHTNDGAKISSTVVRGVIASGDISSAATLLGGWYTVMTSVVEGVADIRDTYKILPPDGRYDVVVTISDRSIATTLCIVGRRLHLPEVPNGDAVISFR